MDKKDLQLFAGRVVTVSKLPKQAKLQMLEWLQNEASKIDIMSFLMDGKIQHIQKESESIVVDRFKANKLSDKIKTFSKLSERSLNRKKK